MVSFFVQIMFHSVKIPELPTAVFPSTAAEVRMDDIWTKVIRKDAFCSMNILSVIISNASIFEIETGAFNERTLIHSLEFVDVRLKTIRSGALRAGANNLTIQYSRFVKSRNYFLIYNFILICIFFINCDLFFSD